MRNIIVLLLVLMVACSAPQEEVKAPEPTQPSYEGYTWKLKSVSENPDDKPLKEASKEGQLTETWTVSQNQIKKTAHYNNVKDDGTQADWTFTLNVVESPPSTLVYGEPFTIKLEAEASGAKQTKDVDMRGMYGGRLTGIRHNWQVSPYDARGLKFPSPGYIIVGYDDEGKLTSKVTKEFTVDWREYGVTDNMKISIHGDEHWIVWEYEREQ